MEAARISGLHGVAFGWHGCLLRHLAVPRGLLAFSQQRQRSLVVQDGAPNLVQVCWIHADCVVVATNDSSPKVRVLAVLDDGRVGSDGDFVQQHSTRWIPDVTTDLMFEVLWRVEPYSPEQSSGDQIPEY